ncbi:hypothetical protein GCM10028801_18880 [Nocardioides maradonensis]
MTGEGGRASVPGGLRSVEPHLLLGVLLVAPSILLSSMFELQIVGQLLAAALAATLLLGRRVVGPVSVGFAAVVLLALCCVDVVSWSGADLTMPMGVARAIGIGLLGAVVAAAAAVVTGRRRLALAATVLALVGLASFGLATDTVIDVLVFLRDSAHGILHGRDPYAMTFRSPFTDKENARFYSPAVLSGHTVTAGFPYPPVVLVGACLGWLLGDVRIAAVLALVATAVVIHTLRGAAPAAFVVLLPGLVWVLAHGWVEPIAVLLLALTVVSFIRGDRMAPVWLGLLLVSKQYFVVVLPLLLLLHRPGTRGRDAWRPVVVAVATGALTLLPFAVWDFHGLWRSLVEFQFLQPYRADSNSLLVWLVNRTGWPPAAVYGVLPLGAGLVVACFLAWRAPRHPAAFAAAIALTLTVLITLSKQAFSNYWFFVAGALMIAALTWDVSERATPEADRTR